MGSRRIVPFAEARARRSSGPPSRWPQVAADFAGEVWPQVQPSFRIAPGETVFTIGSCFARNIERHLVDLGCRVPMTALSLPPEEWDGEPNGAMNRFHPPAFRQCLAWTAQVLDRGGTVDWEADCAPLAFDCGGGRFLDMDMGARGPVTRERFLQRRQHVFEVFRQVFGAGCLILTPGLIEAWRDRATGLWLHETPGHKAMLADPARWELQVLDYPACLQALLDAIDLVRARNPQVRVLITTSPVPMAATFSGQDVRIANSYSKAVLRAACGAAAVERPAVDYFPSYESVALSWPDGVWDEDRLHVASGFVGKIIQRMAACYFEGLDRAGLALQRARSALFDGDAEAAAAAAREALAQTPGEVEAALVLGDALLRLDRLTEAEAALRPLLASCPERAEVWFTLARALARDKARTGEALELVETAAALPSARLEDFRGVAGLIRRKAAPAAAERLARRAVELFPLHPEARHILVDVLEDQGRLAEAAEVLEEAVSLRRTRPEDHVRLARLRELTLGSGLRPGAARSPGGGPDRP